MDILIAFVLWCRYQARTRMWWPRYWRIQHLWYTLEMCGMWGHRQMYSVLYEHYN